MLFPEVAQELSDSDEITEINVYGVSVPGRDGRAGMAAVRLREGVDASPSNVREVMKRLGALATKKLPGYAIPRFVRIMPEIEITGTFKQRKVDLVKAGFDPRTVTDVGSDLIGLRPTCSFCLLLFAAALLVQSFEQDV